MQRTLLPLCTLLIGSSLAHAVPQDGPRRGRPRPDEPLRLDLRGEECLGTSYLLRFTAKREEARAVEAAVLAEVERQRGLLDWRDGELAKLVPGVTTPVSSELRAALEGAESWRARTDGAFDPAVQHLAEVWKSAAEAGEVPADEALAARVHGACEGRWRIDADGVTATEVAWTLDGLGKGAILDAAIEVARAEVEGDVLFDIGGDVTVRGGTQEVSVADPADPSDNGWPLDRVRLTNQTIATSANRTRGVEVAGRHVGHVLDPRTGRPASAVLQASVVASSGADADALATALLVLDPVRGLELIASLDGIECLLVLPDGALHASQGWPSVAGPRSKADAWPAEKRVHLAFTLDRPAASERGGRGRAVAPEGAQEGRRRRGGRGGRGAYRRPYVAAWVERPDGTAVRTLCLWIERERWLRDLHRWYRLYKDDRALIDAVTRPTRNPGEYELVFDGLDDGGEPLPLGEYVFVLEVTREHGTYQLLRHTLDLTQESAEIELEPNVEVAACTLSFGPSGPGTPKSDDGKGERTER